MIVRARSGLEHAPDCHQLVQITSGDVQTSMDWDFGHSEPVKCLHFSNREILSWGCTSSIRYCQFPSKTEAEPMTSSGALTDLILTHLPPGPD